MTKCSCPWIIVPFVTTVGLRYLRHWTWNKHLVTYRKHVLLNKLMLSWCKGDGTVDNVISNRCLSMINHIGQIDCNATRSGSRYGKINRHYKVRYCAVIVFVFLFSTLCLSSNFGSLKRTCISTRFVRPPPFNLLCVDQFCYLRPFYILPFWRIELWVGA